MFVSVPAARFTNDPVTLLGGSVDALDVSDRAAFGELVKDFDNLAPDRWLRSDYIFRERRYSRFVLDTGERTVEPLVHEAFYQTVVNNEYAGGIERKFEPLLPATMVNSFLHRLMWDVLAVLPEDMLAAHRWWEIGVHLMRILARPDQPGHPAPEGMHHDGHAFTSITMIRRENADGGVSLFADLDGNIYRREVLDRPLETVIFADARCLHDVTPLTVSAGAELAIRDVCGFSLNPSDPATAR
jgi:hypothetical protein